MDSQIGRPFRALLVDDEPHITHVVGRRLTKRGFETRVARDGLEALQVAAEFQPDIVISDLQMPRLDGLSLAQQLKASHATSETPVLLISGRGFLLEEERLRQTNIVEVLEKPFSVDAVVELVARITAGDDRRSDAA